MRFPSVDRCGILYHGVGRPSNTGDRGSSAVAPIAVSFAMAPASPSTKGVRGMVKVGDRGSPAPRNPGASATGVRGTSNPAVGDRGSSGPSGNACPACEQHHGWCGARMGW